MRRATAVYTLLRVTASSSASGTPANVEAVTVRRESSEEKQQGARQSQRLTVPESAVLVSWIGESQISRGRTRVPVAPPQTF